MSKFNAREYVKRKYNKTNKEEKNTKSTQKTQSTGFNARDYIKQKYQKQIADSFGLDTLEADINSLAKTIQSVYDGWQTEETMENTRSSIEALQSRITAYQDYRAKYGSKDSADLTELSNNYKSMLEGWDDLKYHYSKYKNAGEYKKALAESEAYQKELDSMPSADLKVVQTEIDNLQKILDTANSKKPKTNLTTSTKKGKGAINDTQKMGEEQKAFDDYLKSVGYSSIEDIEKALGEKKFIKTRLKECKMVFLYLLLPIKNPKTMTLILMIILPKAPL